MKTNEYNMWLAGAAFGSALSTSIAYELTLILIIIMFFSIIPLFLWVYKKGHSDATHDIKINKK